MTASDLPPDLSAFAALLDAQSIQVREAFNYCLCLMMVEAGRMELVRTTPGDHGPIHVFRSVAGEPFAVARPPMTDEDEALMIEALHDILRDEGWL